MSMILRHPERPMLPEVECLGMFLVRSCGLTISIDSGEEFKGIHRPEIRENTYTYDVRGQLRTVRWYTGQEVGTPRAVTIVTIREKSEALKNTRPSPPLKISLTRAVHAAAFQRIW